MTDPLLRFAVPNGSLQEQTLRVLREAGYQLSTQVGRDDRLGRSDGIEFFVRDRENIASLVGHGVFDAGITGADLRMEEGQDDVPVLCDLPYGRATNGPVVYVLAAAAGITPALWESRKKRRIGAERVWLARRCLSDAGVLRSDDHIVSLPGKEEAAIDDGLCDAVFVMTETGSSLKAHNLAVIYPRLLTVSPQLYYRPGLKRKPERFRYIEALGAAMRAVLTADQVVVVTFNIPHRAAKTLKLPAAVSPTISKTKDPKWNAGQVLIRRAQFPATLLQLQRAGARSIFMLDVAAYLPR
ncbi:MAG: ATP phosphoribosyltransferase [Patescibacteria group bacterium]|nr:ATP phosphoribosyltransferase [Patescibacteria group bacterium]